VREVVDAIDGLDRDAAAIRMPRVASPWQTSRAPPWSSTSAMWSGERKPAGGEWSVVKVTISPRPVRETGAIATGCHGQKRAGGTTAVPHCGHRDPWIWSITGGGIPRSGRFHEGHEVVGGEAADRLGQPDVRAHLAVGRLPRQLPDELHHLGDARGAERMAARLEPARRVHR